MWQRLGTFVIKNRLALLIVMLIVTGVMGYFASQVKLSYEFSKAIPSDNPKAIDYAEFRQRFGDDGNLLVIGIQSEKLFELPTFKAYNNLQKEIKKIGDVEDVLSIPSAIALIKDTASEKLNAARIFDTTVNNQATLDSEKIVFFNLPFYRSLLYNPETHAYLMGVRINKDSLNSKKRNV
ncbi:MAG: RND transporter, partial [Ferruginibacter sp.]